MAHQAWSLGLKAEWELFVGSSQKGRNPGDFWALPREDAMNKTLRILSLQELECIHGGQLSVQNRGWRGGSVTTPGGNSVNVSPFATTVTLNNQTANRAASGLNALAAASAIPCPPLATTAGVVGSMVNFMNRGNGVNITVAHGVPWAFIQAKN
jgi:hypothetical protein